jgi:outer membrane protein
MLSTPLNSTDSFIEKAYENQPQIKAAETRILSAQKQIEITKTQFLPSVTATAGLGTSYYNPFSSIITDYLSNTKIISDKIWFV